MKNGAPIKAVTAPTGREVPLSKTLAKRSDTIRNKDPNRHVPIIEKRWFGPMILLMEWGATIPTKEMIPKKEMHIAVIREERSKRTNRTKEELTPKDLALISPVSKAFSSGERRRKTIRDTPTTAMMIQLSDIVALDKSPKVQ